MSKERITGLDFARALSIVGMIIVNYKIAMGAENGGPEWLSVLAGMLEGRASAIFVVLAGIGFSIMTRRARVGNASELREERIVVWKRSAYLLCLGFFLLFVGWSADILHYYSLFLFIASFYIRASNLVLLGTVALVLGCSQWMLLTCNYLSGWDPSFHDYTDFWTANGFVRNLFFNGFHPALPWVCFFLIGMWFGRLHFTDPTLRKKLLFVFFLGFIGSELVSFVAITSSSPYIGGEVAKFLFQTKPMPPNILYMISATSTAILVILISITIAEKYHAQQSIIRFIQTGQMALTHYVLHIVVGLGILDMLGILENGSLPFAVIYSLAYFVVVLWFSHFWRQKFKRGPLEAIMRKL